MMVRKMVDNCDGKGPQIIEVEVPDLTPEEIASRNAKCKERMKTRQKYPSQVTPTPIINASNS